MKRAVYLLLTLLALTTLTLLLTLPTTPTGHITAQPGTVTQLHINSDNPYAAIYGTLNENGQTSTNIQKQTITKKTLHRQQHNCSTTTLIASKTPNPTNIQPIHPTQADNNQYTNPNNPYSYTNTYTQQETFTIQGEEQTFWATTTNGQLQSYTQAIAHNNQETLFITRVYSTGLAYNGELATYQLLLPEGNWYFQTDETTPCRDLPPIQEQEETIETQLRIVLDQRICADSQTTIYAASTNQRTICRQQDMPHGCKPEPEVTITLNGESRTTNEQGKTTFRIPEEATYTVQAQKEEQTTQTTFTARTCLDEYIVTREPTTREAQRAQITTTPFTQEAQEQEPTPISKAEATYALTILLTITTLLLAGIAYTRKDASPLILRARIAYEERKNR